jgi:hypothetical protein
MKSNLNVDTKLYADKVPDILGNSLINFTNKIVGKNSGSKGQGKRGSRGVYGLGAQRRGYRRGGR